MQFTIDEVRDMQSAWPEVAPLVQGIIDYHRPIDQRVLRGDWSQRMLEYMANAPDNLTLLARDLDGRAIGFLNGHLVADDGIFDEALGYVDNAFVDEGWRHRGVASELLRCFEVWCLTRGADEIALNVQSGNDDGFSFWRAAGFELSSYTLRKPLEVRR